MENNVITSHNDILEKYWITEDPMIKNDLRAQIIFQYSYIVKIVVSKLTRQYSGYFEKADLYSCGIIGLIDAIDKFNHSLGVLFQTYAPIRIQGEIIDFIRSQDWAPRELRKKIAQIQQVKYSFESEYNRKPTVKEIAENIPMSESKIMDILRINNMFEGSPLELKSYYGISSNYMNYTVNDPYCQIEQNEMYETIKDFVSSLPTREKTIISLYYYERVPMRIIGDVLKLSESRISQLHGKVIRALRAILTSE